MKKDLYMTTSFNGLTLKNAFVRSATNEHMAQKDDTPSDKLILYYEEMAKHIGLLITGFCYPSPNEIATKNMLGLYKDEQIPQYSYLCQKVHNQNSKILLQIVAGGHFKTRTPSDYIQEEIQNLIYDFISCAQRAQTAGFDGVQLHFAHGYLLSQFLTPSKNMRTDIYGGSYENRVRLHKALLKEIRAHCPKPFHISIKIHCDDFIDQGFTLEECIALTQELQQLGLDSVEISGGNLQSLQTDGFYIKEANEIANALEIPVFVVGGNKNMACMQSQFESTKVKALSMSRALTNDYAFVDDITNISQCIRCGKCYTLGTPCIQQLKKRTLFATDFDGTLSKDHHTITQKDVHVIEQYALHNVFGIVSGRDPISLIICTKRAHIPYDFLICFNGALCLDLHGNILHDEPIQENLKSLLDFLKNSQAISYHIIGYRQVLLQYSEGVKQESIDFEKEIYKEYQFVSSIDELSKVYMLSCEFKDEALAKEHANYVNTHFPHLNASANTNYIDIMATGVSKLQGMKYIQDYFKIERNKISVIGDSYNDLEMIKYYEGYAIEGNKKVEEASHKVVQHVYEAMIDIKKKRS